MRARLVMLKRRRRSRVFPSQVSPGCWSFFCSEKPSGGGRAAVQERERTRFGLRRRMTECLSLLITAGKNACNLARAWLSNISPHTYVAQLSTATPLFSIYCTYVGSAPLPAQTYTFFFIGPKHIPGKNSWRCFYAYDMNERRHFIMLLAGGPSMVVVGSTIRPIKNTHITEKATLHGLVVVY